MVAARTLGVEPGDVLVTSAATLFGLEPSGPPPRETLAEPHVPNVFSEAWGEEAYRTSALAALWEAEWRHLTEPRLPDPRDPKAVKGKDG